MSETARRTLTSTTKDPTAAIFMAAQHLSDLRDMEFRGVPAKDLTRDQMLIIAMRYNQGPENIARAVQKYTERTNELIAAGLLPIDNSRPLDIVLQDIVSHTT